MIIKGSATSLKVLPPDTKINPSEFDYGASYIQQGLLLHKVVKHPLFTYVSSYDDDANKFFEKAFGKPKYGAKEVSLEEDNISKYPYPIEQLKDTIKYFEEIFKEYKTEAAVLLLFHPTKFLWNTFKILQVGASYGNVKYVYPCPEPDDTPIVKAIFESKEAKKIQLRLWEEYDKLLSDGYELIGTIHSHCDFAAFHSGVDDADEINFDGLHITVGKLTKGYDFSARWIHGTAPCTKTIEEIVGKPISEITSGIDKVPFDKRNLTLMRKDIQVPISVNKGKSGTYSTKHNYTGNNFDTDFWSGDWEKQVEAWELEGMNSEYSKDPIPMLREDECVRLISVDDHSAIYVDINYYIEKQKQYDKTHILDPNFEHLLEDADISDDDDDDDEENEVEEIKKIDTPKRATNLLKQQDTRVAVLNCPITNPKGGGQDFRYTQINRGVKNAVK